MTACQLVMEGSDRMEIFLPIRLSHKIVAVIANSVKQSSAVLYLCIDLDCFASLAMTIMG